MKYKSDFEIRTMQFSINVINYCKTLRITIFNKNLVVQVLRSSASVGANYREANNAIGYKDCLLRLRISRKEAKETLYWLQIINKTCDNSSTNLHLIQECEELMKILSAMIHNKKNNDGEF